MVDTSIIMQAAQQPSINLPDILQRSAESAAAIEQIPLLQRQQQAQTVAIEQSQQANEQARQQQDAIRKSGVMYNYARQLKNLPMAQRRTFLSSIPEKTIQDLGIDPQKIQSMAIDDASINTTIAQLEPIVKGQREQVSSRRSESLAGGRITAQELSDGTVRYLEFGKEIPQDQVRERIEKAQQEFIQDQRELNTGRRAGSLEAEADLAPIVTERKERAKTEAKGEESRAQLVIDNGVSASYQLPTIKRTIDLLDDIETGGIESVALRIKQVFGVEGEDEGELSANLGKAVLSQLRETFGAAFTQAEGERLERIEANFGKSPETNKRLLKNALSLSERKVKQALERARTRGDDETVAELEANMDYLIQTGEDKNSKPTQKPQTQKPKRLKFNPETGLLE